jgi:plastocyanin
MHRRTTIFGAAGTVAALCVASFLSGAPAQAAPSTYTVGITQMRYGAVPANLKVGDTIVWVNRDTVMHTVTARDRSFDVRIAPGKQASVVLRKAGTVQFYCIMHPMMRGTLVANP